MAGLSYNSSAQSMQELIRFVETPRTCSYLPDRTASLDVRAIMSMSPVEYADLLARGYRRFGFQVFRPACPGCTECRSLRVLVDRFTPNAGQRRILRKNEKVRAELHGLFVTSEIVGLYNRYHRFMHENRGWPLQQATPASYSEDIVSGATNLGRQWLYFDDDRLIGVALMDEAPGAISLVYCFYDPDWRADSPGTFSVLNQLLYARRENLRYAYLGYWIQGCLSMSYKVRFRPHEILREYPADGAAPVWE